MDYFRAFIIGGLICALVQILLDRTKLLPGRVMVLLVCSGVLLSAGSLSSVLQEVKMYLTRHIRNAIPQNPLSRQMQNPITNLLWNQESITASTRSKIQMRRNTKCQL